MQITVTVREHGTPSAAETQKLYDWLLDDPTIRTSVTTHDAPIPDDTLDGGTIGAILVAIGGVGTALTPALVAWLRSRVGQIRITVTHPDGTTVEMEAQHVERLDGEAFLRKTAELNSLFSLNPISQMEPPDEIQR